MPKLHIKVAKHPLTMDDPSLSDGSSSPSQTDTKLEAQGPLGIPSAPRSRLLTALTPRRCRQKPDEDVKFNNSLILLCAFASAVASGNLFYIYPVLNKAASDFGVSYERASLIPQLLGGGYGLGILFLCPIGDIARIRPTILVLTTLATAAWLGLCLTHNFEVFTALSFVTGFFTVSPQLLIPLVGALAPPDLQATAVSVVLAGLMMGLALPRVITGIAVQYTPWRNIYWAAFGLQCLLVLVMWMFFPDITLPETKSKDGKPRYLQRYSKILGSILKCKWKPTLTASPTHSANILPQTSVRHKTNPSIWLHRHNAHQRRSRLVLDDANRPSRRKPLSLRTSPNRPLLIDSCGYHDFDTSIQLLLH